MLFCLLSAWLCTGAALAHAVRHEVRMGEAVVVALHYTDGEPFAFERYELFRGMGATPVQSGRTDAQGQLVVQPGRDGSALAAAAQAPGSGPWRLRAFSADGHGIDTVLAFDAFGSAQATSAVPGAQAGAHAGAGWARAVLGVCTILGLGALARHLLRRSRN